MNIAVRSPGVGKVLLAHENERALGHTPCVYGTFRRRDLGEGAAEVNRSGAASIWIGPRHTVFDREIDLERTRPVTEPREAARYGGRQMVPQDVGHLRGREIEQGYIGFG
ncbi:Uncharacterised protein [Mycobacteroides abscessus]|nr:Uncharacterised protein [Mycobacteroides abscessus]